MKSHSKSGLLLLELLLTILIFSVCAGVCILVFAQSASLAAESRDLNNSVILAQNAAENLKGGTWALSDSTTFYNKELKMCSESTGYYKVTVNLEENKNDVQFFRVSVYEASGGEALYQIESASYGRAVNG